MGESKVKPKTKAKTKTKAIAKKSTTTPKESKSNSAIDDIRIGLLRKFGTNAIIKGSDMEKARYGRVSTSSISLDLAIGGGVPVGRLIQVAGAKSTGKSTIAGHILKNCQNLTVNWVWTERKEEKGREVVTEYVKTQKGLVCAYLDVEGTMTPEWAKNSIGIDINNWLYSQPSGLEEALEMAHQMQKDGVHLIVIDSIEALEPTKEYISEIGETIQMGIKPKTIGEYCRKYTATNNGLARKGKLPCTVILINQLREKIGAYGDNEYTPGGRSIEFYASLDLRLRRADWISIGTGDNKEIIGWTVKFKSNKNKTYKQQQSGEFDFYFDEGGRVEPGNVDNFKEIVVEGIAWGVVDRAGAWFKYKGENLAQGADNTIAYLAENLDVFEEIKKELFDIIKKEEEKFVKGEEK